MHNSCGHEYPVREIWKRSYACKSYFPFQGLTFWILIYIMYTLAEAMRINVTFSLKTCYKLYWCQFKQLNNYYYVKFFVFIGYKLHKLPEETTSRVRLSTQHLLRGGSRGISEGAIFLADEVSKGSVQILHLLARALWSRSSQRISVLHHSVCGRHFQ